MYALALDIPSLRQWLVSNTLNGLFEKMSNLSMNVLKNLIFLHKPELKSD